jgi:hypothetical protein
LFVAVQLALIGEDALALGQMNYQGARWAAVNTCATPAQVLQYMLSAGSPSITTSGGSCGTQLTMTMTDSNGGPTNYTGSTCSTPTGVASSCTTSPTPRSFGTAVTITVKFNASKAIFLGNGTKPWMGLINFPTTLTSTETAMAE